MKRISSRGASFNKKLSPVMWFGMLAFMGALVAFGEGEKAPASDLAFFYVILLAMAIGGYFMMKKMLFDLIDEVYDEHDSLLFRNRGTEVRVNLEDIKNISYEPVTSPQRVTLTLREPSELGSRLTFSPKAGFMPMKRSALIDDLIDRVDRARG